MLLLSAAKITRSLSAAINEVIQTPSHETTLEYVMLAGGSVQCPPATK
jgi:hypothetical protein